MDKLKKLRLKIWVEDENGKIKSAQLLAGGLPYSSEEPNLIVLDWTENSKEIDYKVLINSIACLLKAKYGDKYIERFPIERDKIVKLLDL